MFIVLVIQTLYMSPRHTIHNVSPRHNVDNVSCSHNVDNMSHRHNVSRIDTMLIINIPISVWINGKPH